MIIDSQRESVYLSLSQLERDLDFFLLNCDNSWKAWARKVSGGASWMAVGTHRLPSRCLFASYSQYTDESLSNWRTSQGSKTERGISTSTQSCRTSVHAGRDGFSRSLRTRAGSTWGKRFILRLPFQAQKARRDTIGRRPAMVNATSYKLLLVVTTRDRCHRVRAMAKLDRPLWLCFTPSDPSISSVILHFLQVLVGDPCWSTFCISRPLFTDITRFRWNMVRPG